MGLAGAAVAVIAPGAARARHDAVVAQASLRDAVRDAELIATMRTEVPEAPTDDSSRGGLTPRITAALERAGLPVGALASLSPEAESQVVSQAGVRVSRRRATLTLAGVTLPAVGRFLDAWRAAEPGWTPMSIDVSPAGGQAPEAGGDLPLRAVVVIESITARPTGDQR
ncbi:MAG: hypothetical protein ACK4WH_09765 [Phycisphaerales bacterium]